MNSSTACLPSLLGIFPRILLVRIALDQQLAREKPTEWHWMSWGRLSVRTRNRHSTAIVTGDAS